ncbi:uncharacterized protein L3040_008628 [Drepanopeziza brunnea f. sp. 'multigermtubi']|uniref:uncharacterized protein n=1 Tax=Drepanopeziza brunnea f. sp. 'multigermtubi' TaxID=698441 RepID=UPI0023863C2F|nr:hypothetical protein L3040_008628 [Drepanopeziza brunnea f. sp. 'multigermtubi']
MIFINTIYAALLAASAVTAAPSLIEPRIPGEATRKIKLCEDIEYKRCNPVLSSSGACMHVPFHLVNHVSSFDTGHIVCTFYSDGNCSTARGKKYVKYGGRVSDISRNPAVSFLKDAIASFKCNY